MKIAIGADSAGKPLLDVIAAHLATKPEHVVADLSQSGFYADLRKNWRRQLSMEPMSAAFLFAAQALASVFQQTRCRAFAPR